MQCMYYLKTVEMFIGIINVFLSEWLTLKYMHTSESMIGIKLKLCYFPFAESDVLKENIYTEVDILLGHATPLHLEITALFCISFGNFNAIILFEKYGI